MINSGYCAGYSFTGDCGWAKIAPLLGSGGMTFAHTTSDGWNPTRTTPELEAVKKRHLALDILQTR